MTDWLPISDDTPHNQWLLLWLKAEDGSDEPLGELIGIYKNTGMGEQWCQKIIGGVMNDGLRKDLVTHYKLLDGGPVDGTE